MKLVDEYSLSQPITSAARAPVTRGSPQQPTVRIRLHPRYGFYTTPDTDSTAPSQPVVEPHRGSYELKPSQSRRTNTARISSLRLPPPAYTANHNDVNGTRPPTRERGQDHILPTYTESLEPQRLPKVNTPDTDLEAGVNEQAAQRSEDALKRRRTMGIFFPLLIIVVLTVYFVLQSEGIIN